METESVRHHNSNKQPNGKMNCPPIPFQFLCSQLPPTRLVSACLCGVRIAHGRPNTAKPTERHQDWTPEQRRDSRHHWDLTKTQPGHLAPTTKTSARYTPSDQHGSSQKASVNGTKSSKGVLEASMLVWGRVSPPKPPLRHHHNARTLGPRHHQNIRDTLAPPREEKYYQHTHTHTHHQPKTPRKHPPNQKRGEKGHLAAGPRPPNNSTPEAPRVDPSLAILRQVGTSPSFRAATQARHPDPTSTGLPVF